ncbi:MAG: hypothetical protein JWO46_1937 [Nocardioidaceae bacterium]|nr:hypothetical protein [Nocardioidaceae bacterium]
MTWLLVALGAGIGSGLRYTASRLLDDTWPRGTFLVNTVGSFLLGLFTGLALDGSAIALLGTGFCGGLTTFSSLLVQSVDRGPRRGSTYLLVTVAVSLLACWLGFVLGA